MEQAKWWDHKPWVSHAAKQQTVVLKNLRSQQSNKQTRIVLKKWNIRVNKDFLEMDS